MDQNNTSTATPEITFPDILRMFRGKLKIFIIMTVVALIVGAVIGGSVSFMFASYGEEVSFYLTTTDGTKALLPLLHSDSFAEKLLLDENGLPPKSECNEADYEAALAAVRTYQEARVAKRELSKKIGLYSTEFAIIANEHSRLVSNYDKLFNELKIYLSAQDEIAKGENHAETIAKYEAMLDEASSALEKYTKETYDPAKAINYQYDNELATARRTLLDTRLAATEAVEKVLAPWRESKEVKDLIKTITQSVTYEYAKIVDENDPNSGLTSEANQNAAFLVVSINTDNDKEMTEFIVEKIKDRVPEYVVENIERLTGANEPQCTLISTFSQTKRTDDYGLIKTALTGAVICAVVVVAVGCTIVIVKNILPPDLLEKKEKKDKKTEKA